MRRLFAVDGGACAAVAVFSLDHRTLQRVLVVRFVQAGLAPAELAKLPSTVDGDHVVYEKPRLYPGPRQTARPNDLVTTALRTGMVVGALCKGADRPGLVVVGLDAFRWKGQLSKGVHHQRIRGLLDSAETRAVEETCASLAKGLWHNVLDAVGLGLYALRRADARGVEREQKEGDREQ